MTHSRATRVTAASAILAAAVVSVVAAPRLTGSSGNANAATAVNVTTIAFAAGSTWAYHNAGSDLGTSWRATSFDDSTWNAGAGQLGFGDGDEKTVLAAKSATGAKIITNYFRKAFTVSDPTAVTAATLRIQRDDGAVVYLNGVEVARSNMPAGTVTAATLASTGAADDGTAWQTVSLPVTALQAGANVVAVEVHQNAASSSDVSFDGELTVTSSQVVERSVVLPAGSAWRYNDTGALPDVKWASPAYSDDAWKTGFAEFGYGDGDETTIVSYGSSATSKFRTTYFRQSVSLAAVNGIRAVTMRLRRDDGAVVYLNGVEVARSNMPTGTVSHSTRAKNAADDGKTWQELPIPLSAVTEGINTFAVEVHQDSSSSSDVSFDAEVIVDRTAPAAASNPTPTQSASPTPTQEPVPTTPWKILTTKHNLDQSSGLAPTGDGRFWFHEDYRAERPGAVYLLEADGSVKSWVRFGSGLPTGYANRPLGTVDIEAMTVHNGYVYLADTGDAYTEWATSGKRPHYSITRFPLPTPDTLPPGETVIPANQVQQVHFTYATPASYIWRNSEAFVIDPTTGDMLVVEKLGTTSTAGARVWRVPANWGNTTPVAAPEVAALPTGKTMISDATIASDGKTIWLRNATTVFAYPITSTVAAALNKANPTATATLPTQPQGEGLTTSTDGRHLIAQSEGLTQPYWGIPKP